MLRHARLGDMLQKLEKRDHSERFPGYFVTIVDLVVAFPRLSPPRHN
jgi:hypothetical protein